MDVITQNTRGAASPGENEMYVLQLGHNSHPNYARSESHDEVTWDNACRNAVVAPHASYADQIAAELDAKKIVDHDPCVQVCVCDGEKVVARIG